MWGKEIEKEERRKFSRFSGGTDSKEMEQCEGRKTTLTGLISQEQPSFNALNVNPV